MSTCDARRRRTARRRAAITSLLATAATACALLGGDGVAHAQSAQDQATARALFNEARQLMKAGRYVDACPKLESAARLYEGSGLLLNLGDCYEHLGRTASAWTEFGAAVEAAERARRGNDYAEAQRRQAAVEPRLARLVVRVAHPAPGLVVKRDGSELARGAWGAAIPVDPGEHMVSAEASDRVAWAGTIRVTEAGKTVTLDVPELPPPASRVAEPAAAAGGPAIGAAVGATSAPPTLGSGEGAGAAPTHDEVPTAPGYWTGRRIASASIAVVGALALGTGGALALVAKQRDDTAKSEAANNHADSASAVGLGNVATVLCGAGAAVAATGLVLWLTAPDARVHVGATPSAVVAWGSF
jgi:hypothetical protein